METCPSAFSIWERQARHHRLTDLPNRHTAVVEPCDVYGELDSEEEFAWSEVSWDQLRGEPTRSSRFMLAELCCGGKLSGDKDNLVV